MRLFGEMAPLKHASNSPGPNFRLAEPSSLFNDNISTRKTRVDAVRAFNGFEIHLW
jgi:hypothetical protein